LFIHLQIFFKKSESKFTMISKNISLLIAPCGMNCGICYAFLREKNKCPGCHGPNDSKPVTRVVCKIKTCEVIVNGKAGFCFECTDFPCYKLKHLDKRYRTKYYMSMIANLQCIRDSGIAEFLLKEKSNWTCTECGGTICVHTAKCCDCGKNIGSDKIQNFSVN